MVGLGGLARWVTLQHYFGTTLLKGCRPLVYSIAEYIDSLFWIPQLALRNVPSALRLNLCLLYYSLLLRREISPPILPAVTARAQNNFHDHLFSFPYCYKSLTHVLVMPPSCPRSTFTESFLSSYILTTAGKFPYWLTLESAPPQPNQIASFTQHSPTSVYGMSNTPYSMKQSPSWEANWFCS